MIARNGKWHRHSGAAECPVDPRDGVILCHLAEGYPITTAAPAAAASADWSVVVAFRVVVAHRDPRIFWIAGGQAFADQAEAEATGLPVIEAVERLSEAVA